MSVTMFSSNFKFFSSSFMIHYPSVGGVSTNNILLPLFVSSYVSPQVFKKTWSAFAHLIIRICWYFLIWNTSFIIVKIKLYKKCGDESRVIRVC